MKLKFYKANPRALTPSFGTPLSACFDICACLNGVEKIKAYTRTNEMLYLDCPYDSEGVSYIDIPAEFRVLVPTGIIFDIPDDYSIRIHARSGLSLKEGLVMQNSEGIIDADYVEETFIMIKNDSLARVRIKHGMRIAQGELVPVLKYGFEQVDVRPETKTNRTGGFGSTGV
jgi:deoxyuridine 5'-triphosphate nucleotidohydrolase